MSESPRTRPVRHESVRLAELEHVYQRPPLGEYLTRLWERRHFIRADARGRVISGSRGTLLGMGWLILRPILDGAAYYVIFGLVLRTSRGIENFVGYLLIGIFLFQFTARCLSGGANSLVTGKNLLKAFSFPRAALPIGAVARETLSFIPVLGVMLLLILALPPTEQITWRWLLLPLILALQLAFAYGLALAAARATAHIPDLSQLISVLTRFWLYGSAVFFSYDSFDSYPGIQAVMEVNPMFVVLDMTRDVLLYAETPTLQSWALLVAWSVALGAGGTVYFWRGEERYGSL